jgi:hypothetical protein
MKRLISAFLFVIALHASGQSLTGMDNYGNMNQFNNDGSNTNFNPHNNDTTRKSVTVPKGIYVWTVDRKLGNIIKAEVDTLPHLFPQSTLGTGTYGEYNTLGSNYTSRLSRIFINRPIGEQFIFTQYYNQVQKSPDQFHFTNTLSPITNLNYNSCGDKQNGEDRLEAKFAVNFGKKLGIGFDLDYDYARGYYQNQNISHFNATLYSSYLDDKYQMHVLFTNRHQKATENGGITNDDYITHPELFTESYTENEIPVILSSNWNRNDSRHFFLTHRYNVGFYREVPMTEKEIQAKKEAERTKQNAEANNRPKGRDEGKTMNASYAGRPADAKVMGDEPGLAKADTVAHDTTRIKVSSKEVADSLLAAEPVDSARLYMKKEFVPVTSFIHTLDYAHYDRTYLAYRSPKNYYENTYFNNVGNDGYIGDSICDQTKYQMIRNTVGVGLLEGFNKWAKAGLQAYATHEFRRFDMPETDGSGTAYMGRWTEHTVSIGARLSKTQGKTLHYNLSGETWLLGEDLGQLKLDFSTDLNFSLWGDSVKLAAKAYLYRLKPTFYERHYHSKHFWWDNSLDMTHRMRAEGLFSYQKTKTQLRVAIEEIQNYTYFGIYNNRTTSDLTGMKAQVHQSSGILHVLTAQIDQKMSLGPIHWDNQITYQTSSDKSVLPLPMLNVFSNLYLKFVYAKVLTVELGGCATYFTAYEAPDYLPQLNQFAIQENGSSKVELGNFPIIDVYANLHLKHARFFIMMNNVAHKSFNQMNFLVPHYALNRQILKMGVSWNFFN